MRVQNEKHRNKCVWPDKISTKNKLHPPSHNSTDKGKPLSDPQNETLRKVRELYTSLHDLTIDLRSTSGNLTRALTFKRRVLDFLKLKLFQRYALQDCTHKVTYIHLLLDHIPEWMVIWCKLLDLGYGAFSGASGEHLNKLIKSLELGHTDLSGNRFQQIVQLMRVRAFHYPHMLLDDPSRDQTCSRCNQKGHNKKNKSCPMHPSQPAPAFSDSD